MTENCPFYRGAEFQTHDEFMRIFEDWCSQHFIAFIHRSGHEFSQYDSLKATLKYKDIHLICVQSGEQEERDNEKDGTSLKVGCLFSIKLDKNKYKGTLVSAEFLNQHNHPLDESLYKTYPQNRKITKEIKEVVKFKHY